MMLLTSVFAAPTTLEDITAHILLSRRLTQADRQQLKQAFLHGMLTETELIMIDRLLYGVRKGLLQVVN